MYKLLVSVLLLAIVAVPVRAQQLAIYVGSSQCIVDVPNQLLYSDMYFPFDDQCHDVEQLHLRMKCNADGTGTLRSYDGCQTLVEQPHPMFTNVTAGTCVDTGLIFTHVSTSAKFNCTFDRNATIPSSTAVVPLDPVDPAEYGGDTSAGDLAVDPVTFSVFAILCSVTIAFEFLF